MRNQVWHVSILTSSLRKVLPCGSRRADLCYLIRKILNLTTRFEAQIVPDHFCEGKSVVPPPHARSFSKLLRRIEKLKLLRAWFCNVKAPSFPFLFSFFSPFSPFFPFLFFPFPPSFPLSLSLLVAFDRQQSVCFPKTEASPRTGIGKKVKPAWCFGL